MVNKRNAAWGETRWEVTTESKWESLSKFDRGWITVIRWEKVHGGQKLLTPLEPEVGGREAQWRPKCRSKQNEKSMWLRNENRQSNGVNVFVQGTPQDRGDAGSLRKIIKKEKRARIESSNQPKC